MDKFKPRFINLFSFLGLRWWHKKSELVIILEDASKHQIGHDHIAENSYLKESWSSTVSEMDSKAATSHTKAPSASVQNQTSDHLACSSRNSNSISKTEFTNNGLILWTQIRQQWVTLGKQSQKPSTQVIEPRLSWDATYESLLGSDKPFPQAIPLSEMVDFLIDIWDQEGLYD